MNNRSRKPKVDEKVALEVQALTYWRNYQTWRDSLTNEQRHELISMTRAQRVEVIRWVMLRGKLI